MANDRIAVVTVHGTNDTAKDGSLDGAKWFQRGSAFAQRLLPRLAQQGVEAEIVPHLWTGANSAQARERGARALAKRVRELHGKYAGVHVIGHSHGGNVANEAATMLGWRLRKRARPLLSSISTVGTPFFRVRLSGSLLMVAFLVLCLISLVGLIVIGALLALMLPLIHLDAATYAQEFIALRQAAGDTWTDAELQAHVAREMAEARSLRATLFLPAVLTPPALIVLPIAAYQGVRSIRIQRRQNPEAKIFSIWHPNDEAISALKRVENLDLEPFKRGAFWRASATSGLRFGVPSAFFLVGVAALTALGLAFGLRITDDTYRRIGDLFGFDAVAIFGGLSAADLTLVLTIAAVLTPALAFTVVYLIVRVLHGIVVELLGRPVLNNVVRGALRGMAFGRDGDVRLDAVATHSHNYGCRPLELTGEVAERMRQASKNATGKLIEEYRWRLFAVEPNNDVFDELSRDDATWDSLIHTTYFDQPEVVDALADYIAESVGRERATS